MKKPWYEGARYQAAKLQRETDKTTLDAETAAEEEANRQLNAELRKQYLAGLEAKRLQQLQDDEEQFDRLVGPEKISRRRRWLIDNPGFDEQYFESHVWPMIRAELKAQDTREAVEHAKQEMMAEWSM